MFYGHFCAYGKLNGPSEVTDETPFRNGHAEIRTQVIAICGPTRYQLDYGGALKYIIKSSRTTNNNYNNKKKLQMFKDNT